MPRFIAFLRAVNAGPGRAIKMDFLHGVFESLHFSEVSTFIGSGNVVFETRTRNAKTIARKVEKGLREALGYEVPTFVRTDAELRGIVNCRQFRQSDANRGADFNIIFLADAPTEGLRREIM